MTFSLNLKGNLINWEKTILHAYNIDFSEKTLRDICLVKKPIYAVVPPQSMIKSIRSCEMLGGKFPRPYNSPEVEEKLKQVIKQNFGTECKLNK